MAGGRSWLAWTGIGCGVVLVVLVALALGGYWLVRSATTGPEEIGRAFLAAAAQGDYPGAHAFFSAPLKEKQPLETFSASARANASLFKVKAVAYTERSIDLAGAKLAGTATLDSGTSVPISFSFVKENDTWKLLGYHIGARE